MTVTIEPTLTHRKSIPEPKLPGLIHTISSSSDWLCDYDLCDADTASNRHHLYRLHSVGSRIELRIENRKGKAETFFWQSRRFLYYSCSEIAHLCRMCECVRARIFTFRCSTKTELHLLFHISSIVNHNIWGIWIMCLRSSQTISVCTSTCFAGTKMPNRMKKKHVVHYTTAKRPQHSSAL